MEYYNISMEKKQLKGSFGIKRKGIKMDEIPNYYAIIPASVRYNNDLKATEKLMYGEISALSNKDGICYATNSYFAGLYNVEKETISRWIAHLKELGFVNLKIEYKPGTKEIIKRIIEINGIPVKVDDDTYIPNNQERYCVNHQEGIDKKVKENNTSINNKKKIYKRKEFKPPDIEEIRAYCLARKNNVDPQKFYDYYSANDWRDKDNNPVKSWKQKVITWEGCRKKANVPDWLDKKIESEPLSPEEKVEMEKLLEEFK